jgi:hypothetical protein
VHSAAPLAAGGESPRALMKAAMALFLWSYPDDDNSVLAVCLRSTPTLRTRAHAAALSRRHNTVTTAVVGAAQLHATDHGHYTYH